MSTWSRRRPASTTRRTRPVLEVLEERALLAAPAWDAPPSNLASAVRDPPASTAPAPTDPTPEYSSEKYANATGQKGTVPTPTPTATVAPQPVGVTRPSYDSIDWVRAPRVVMTNAASSGQAVSDPGAIAEAVRALRKATDPPDAPAPPQAASPESLPGNEILALPTTPTLFAATGIGFGGAAAMAAEFHSDESIAARAMPAEGSSSITSPGGDELAAALVLRLSDLTPQAGPVLAGNPSGPREIADLTGRVGQFFGQLGALEHAVADGNPSLGLAPWVVAVAASVVAMELGRRRLGRPALDLAWARRHGSSALSTEEL